MERNYHASRAIAARRSRFVVAVVVVVVVEWVDTVAPGRADAAGRTPAKLDAVAGAALGRIIQHAQGGNGGGQRPSPVLLPARVLEVVFPSPASRPLVSQWQWQYHHGAVAAAAARFAVLVAAPACVEVGILARGRRVVVCITALVDGARFWLDAAAKAKGSSESTPNLAISVSNPALLGASFTYCPPDSGCTTGDALSIDFYTDGVHEDYSFYADTSCNDLFASRSISSACLELSDGGIGSFKKAD
ncbi:hypothetical protein K438DRAFT_1982608 [Mycena galopus ATCC 62051]|nr:hypothetical protein K438DRAFT_1982608 [Mycena galopus ATCC 62051]